jgi:SAM-dependent methyltransferase
VLDVGCGTGRTAAALAERYGAKVWGVDPSEEMLAVARQKVPASVGLKAGSAEDLPFRDGWFERAVMVLVVHHVDRGRALPDRGWGTIRDQHARPVELRRDLAGAVLPVVRRRRERALSECGCS